MSDTLPKLNTTGSINKGAGEEFHYSGYFEWPGVYDHICNWMTANQMKLFEKVFKDKTSKEGFTDREIGLFGEKKVDRMLKYRMYVDIKMWDCQKVEVTKDGKTQTLSRGRFRVRIKTEVNRDFQGLFNQSDFWRKMWGVYSKIKKHDYSLQEWDYWYYKAAELHESLRDYLKTQT